MPQLQINQGPQDALLYDNTRSYFTNVGYVRTSNFQMELRDVDPQNSATLGSTVQFVIPKAADLLGPVDLLVDFTKVANDFKLQTSTLADGESVFAGWVESLGFALVDKIVFSVGSHDVETISGDQLYITNELMRGDEHRFGTSQVLKTGRPLVRADCTTAATTWDAIFDTSEQSDTNRLICAQYEESGTDSNTDKVLRYDGKSLIIPLGLFFTKHPSQYFPLAAIAGCNDVRISIKLRTLNELLVIKSSQTVTSNIVTAAAPGGITKAPSVNIDTGSCRLRCHYVHVTGPEASLLMNKEHVRLLKLWTNYPKQGVISSVAAPVTKALFDFELPFLHPVQELIIVIRKVSEMSASTDPTAKTSDYDKKARAKNYFAFHGGGKDPNIESQRNSVNEVASIDVESYLEVENFRLTLNGQERHPSLAGRGLDRKYLMDRLMPMLHSNTTSYFGTAAAQSFNASERSSVAANGELTVAPGAPHQFAADLRALEQMVDRKEIYVYPFALNPEGANPSGAVNFSKVSHAKLKIEGKAYSSTAHSEEYRCDVYGVHFNWLQIKDGRALTSFA